MAVELATPPDANNPLLLRSVPVGCVQRRSLVEFSARKQEVCLVFNFSALQSPSSVNAFGGGCCSYEAIPFCKHLFCLMASPRTEFYGTLLPPRYRTGIVQNPLRPLCSANITLLSSPPSCCKPFVAAPLIELNLTLITFSFVTDWGRGLWFQTSGDQ